MRSITGLLATMFLLAGCPSDGDDDTNDPAKLVGEWASVGDDAISLTIGDDGTYLIEDDNGPEAGTFSATTTRLTIAGPSVESEVSYVVRGDQLLLNAFLPVGSVDGFVGEWHVDSRQGTDTQSIDVDLRADHTLDFALESTEDGELAATGTWAEAGDELVLTLQVEGPNGPVEVPIAFHTIDDIAFGNPLFERVD
jgi:hypothetical protein